MRSWLWCAAMRSRIGPKVCSIRRINASPFTATVSDPPRFSSSKYDPWLRYRFGQGQYYTESASSRKVNAVECILNKTDATVSGGIGQSSNIFLKPQVMLYDGVCRLCNGGVRFVIRADTQKHISFCAVQSEAAEPYLLVCGLTREDVLDRFLFVEGPGQFSQASTAALRIALYLPFPYPLLGIFLFIPAPLRDFIYDYVAKRRYKWFGRAESCILPSEEILTRFIDRKEIIAKLMKKGNRSYEE